MLFWSKRRLINNRAFLWPIWFVFILLWLFILTLSKVKWLKAIKEGVIWMKLKITDQRSHHIQSLIWKLDLCEIILTFFLKPNKYWLNLSSLNGLDESSNVWARISNIFFTGTKDSFISKLGWTKEFGSNPVASFLGRKLRLLMVKIPCRKILRIWSLN